MTTKMKELKNIYYPSQTNRFCVNCGNQNHKNFSFCPNCGIFSNSKTETKFDISHKALVDLIG